MNLFRIHFFHRHPRSSAASS